jgi:quaternary ammonium compound-resistance protein SugE
MGPWSWIVVAGVLEVGWALGLKWSEGLSRPWPAAVTIVGMIASFWCLAQGVRDLPIGTGYAVWTGIGAAGTAVLGIILLGESVAPARLLCLLLVIGGTVGLKLTA